MVHGEGRRGRWRTAWQGLTGPGLALTGALLLAGCGMSSPSRTLEAPDRTWTWVDFPESRCMNGTATGIGLNLREGSDRVLLFLAGGGACFDDDSCQNLVANREGFGEAEFHQRVAEGRLPAVLDRGAPGNPFRDWNLVYVPYCSGDVHAGSNPDGWSGLMHLGYRNIGLYLERLVPTFAEASQVVLSGASAGGLGATLNFDRVQQAFGEVPVVLLNDSGVALSSAYMRPCLQQQWREAWNLDETLPADCVDCREDLVQLMPFLARKYPTHRFGLIASTWDEVMRQHFSYGYMPDCARPGEMPAEEFSAGVTQLREELLAPYPHFSVYSPRTTEHVFLDAGLGGTTVSGVPLPRWVEGLVRGTPGWGDVEPSP